jgi:hypothetical protein
VADLPEWTSCTPSDAAICALLMVATVLVPPPDPVLVVVLVLVLVELLPELPPAEGAACTTAVAFDNTGLLLPSLLLAISWTRIVEPTSADVSMYVGPVAPAMDAQLSPAPLQRSHWSE